MNMVVLRRLTSLTRHRLWDWLAMQFGSEAVVDIDALHHFCVPQRRIMRDKLSHVDLPVTTKRTNNSISCSCLVLLQHLFTGYADED